MVVLDGTGAMWTMRCWHTPTSQPTRAVLRVVRDEDGVHDLPVVTNVDVGQTDPMWTVPQGGGMRIAPEASALTFLEPAVR